MKIRTGFVSNSSSSSFVVIGKKTRLSDVSLQDFQDKNWLIETDYYYDGKVNIYTRHFADAEKEELFHFLRQPEPDDEDSHLIATNYLVEVFKYEYESGEFKLAVTDLPDEGEVYVVFGEEDQHSPTDMAAINALIHEGGY